MGCGEARTASFEYLQSPRDPGIRQAPNFACRQARNVCQRVAHHHRIHARVGQRQRLRVAGLKRDARIPAPCLRQHLRAEVEPRHLRAALRGPSQLVGVDVSDLHSDGGAARI